MGYYHRSLQAIEPEPIEPVVIPSEHRADFLTMVLANGQAEFDDAAGAASTSYALRPAHERQMVRDAHKAAGMTRYCFDGVQDFYDAFDNPAKLMPFFEEWRAIGIGPGIFVCPEDAPQMQAKYSPISKYNAALQASLRVWAPVLSELWVGVEVDEVWTPDEILQVGKAARAVYQGPIIVHFKSGRVTPNNISTSWLDKANQAGFTHIGYQANHPPVEDSGGAFLADPNTIRNELKGMVAKVAGRLIFFNAEYAYFGRNPSQQTINHVRGVGYTIGDKSLEEPGCVGISNGGPGYFPPEPIDPVDSQDDIDINTVWFFDKSGGDITKAIRSWPVESKLTPSWPRGNVKVDFSHTACASWPDGTGSTAGVNANTWNVINRNGRWEGYTTDFLRRGAGNTTKNWYGELDRMSSEPITYLLKPGTTICLMVSRIARYGTFPAGAGRSQLVRVITP